VVDSRKDVDSLVDALRCRIPIDHLLFTFTRSAGPGGQHVNKVSTRVTLRFDLDGSGALSESERRTIRAKLAGRVSKSGQLRVVSMRHRTQRANRRAAVDRFYELLAYALTRQKPRRPTKVPRAARERRLSDKRHQSRRIEQRLARFTNE